MGGARNSSTQGLTSRTGAAKPEGAGPHPFTISTFESQKHVHFRKNNRNNWLETVYLCRFDMNGSPLSLSAKSLTSTRSLYNNYINELSSVKIPWRIVNLSSTRELRFPHREAVTPSSPLWRHPRFICYYHLEIKFVRKILPFYFNEVFRSGDLVFFVTLPAFVKFNTTWAISMKYVKILEKRVRNCYKRIFLTSEHPMTGKSMDDHKDSPRIYFRLLRCFEACWFNDK